VTRRSPLRVFYRERKRRSEHRVCLVRRERIVGNALLYGSALVQLLERAVLALDVIDSVWRISPGHPDQRTAVAPEFRDIRLVGAVATHEPVRPDSPELVARCAPLFLQFSRSFDLRFRVQDFDWRPKRQRIVLSYVREQLFDRLAVSANIVQKCLKPLRVALGHAGQWI